MIVSTIVFGSILLQILPIISSGRIVQTQYGNVMGITTAKAQAFLGIPFAAPPTGQRRWRDPESPRPWSPNVYNATKLKSACPQKGCRAQNPPFMCPNVTSEDCLHLNIWTPLSANETSMLPVMVYIHGGNFNHMFASASIFNGESLAYKGNIVMVNLDYRIGALGFLLTPAARREPKSSGNYGILDQRFALKWVKENIKNFGGDPDKITLFGESAGAQSVVVHLMTEESSQYFTAAIVQSAPISLPFKTEQEMLFLSDLVSDKLGCRAGDMDCLLNKTADEVATAQFAIRNDPTSPRILEFFEPWVPYVDGKVVPMEPLDGISQGYYGNKPLIIGTTTEETRPFIYEGFRKPVSPLEYSALLSLLNIPRTVDILSLYPPTVDEDERDLLQTPATDFVFTCCTRNYTRAATQRNDGKVWYYIYAHAFSFVEAWANLTFCKGHVCHGSELPFVFQSAYLYNYTMTANEVKLSDSMVKYWTNFAKTHDPNLGEPVDVAWPVYSADNDWLHLQFDTPSNIIGENYRKPYCDFWDEVGYEYNPLERTRS